MTGIREQQALRAPRPGGSPWGPGVSPVGHAAPPLLSAHSALSPEKGTELLEDVARLLPLPASVFADVA